MGSTRSEGGTPVTNAKPRQRLGRIRVITAHPEPGARRAVRDALAGERDIVVAADARNHVEVLELSAYYKPELVLIDRGLPPAGGLAAAAQIAAAGRSSAILLSDDPDDPVSGVPALRAGVRGIVALDAPPAQLADALRAVAAGQVAISRRLTLHVVELLREGAGQGGWRPVRSVLTNREWQVLDLLCEGASTREIAATLELSDHTVYGHVKRMLRKLGVSSRAEAISAAGSLRRGRV
jgi:DNA-binding NarL/FixJ family response regulator